MIRVCPGGEAKPVRVCGWLRVSLIVGYDCSDDQLSSVTSPVPAPAPPPPPHQTLITSKVNL